MKNDEPQAHRASWQPRILAFVCRWCTYAGADLAGTSRLKYPHQIRIVKLPCSGRIDPLFLLRGFQMGADGVLVSGCHPGDCHYTSGNYYARRRWILFRALLDFVGLEPERLHFSWVSAAEGAKFVDIVKMVTDAVRLVGPFPGFAPPAERRIVPPAPVPSAMTGEARPPSNPELLRADLAQGSVRAILGYRAGRRPGSLRPAWASSPDELAGLRFAAGAQPFLVTLMLRRLREEPDGICGILAGPKELEAIDILTADHQIDPARLRMYRQDGEAAVSPDKEPWERYGVPGPDRPPRERWDFWTAQFARCLRCNACREGCSLCACLRCVTEKTRPRWIDASPTPAGNWLWNVTRAFHQAGRCIDCGSCTEGCPAGIPLGALNLAMARAADRAFRGPPNNRTREQSIVGHKNRHIRVQKEGAMEALWRLEDLKEWARALMGSHRVVAPVAGPVGAVWGEVRDPEEILWDYGRTVESPRSCLIPRSEPLFAYDLAADPPAITELPIDATPTVLLLLRSCDVAGLRALDPVMRWDCTDESFEARRANTLLVSLGCREAPSPETCFCQAVGLDPGKAEQADIAIEAVPDGGTIRYRVVPLTEAGRERLASGPAAPAEALAGAGPAKTYSLDIERARARLRSRFDDPMWERISEACLGCGTCAFVCPSCHCFDIVDEGDWRRGQRVRNWDSCAFSHFTVHASGHNPRPRQWNRFRQRVYHKFLYYPEKFGRLLCTGCGRCIDACPAGMDLIEVLEGLAAKEGNQP